jgi:ectoine hydroxylase-related dioxygenase (phytanoyl-CoA dioxygenase family)
MAVARLTDEQRRLFEDTGFLVIPEALPVERVEELRERSLGLYEAERQALGLGPHAFWEMRNCILADEVFLPLLDWPATFPLVVDLLGPNIQLSTSHLTVLPPAPAEARREPGGGWHRDGGTSAGEMAEPHPRLFIKIAYWLSDTTHPESGAMRLVPGSNRLIGRPPTLPGADEPVGAIDLRVPAGTAVLFEQRTWHCRGNNYSNEPRVGLFIGYSYRWIRPMDYVTMPAELLARSSPIRRQLLGDAQTQMGYYLPKDEDLPLREWARQRKERGD